VLRAFYCVGGDNGTSNITTAGECFAGFWNPSGTVRLHVTQVQLLHTGGTASNVMRFYLARTTARGTPNATVTPDADNAYERLAAPPSGAVLDLGNFSVEPTEVTPYIFRAYPGQGQGAGAMWTLKAPLHVPPGTGLGLFVTDTVTLRAAVTFEWWE
jgi:hypothetical protein